LFSALGDAVGFHWEFDRSTSDILKQAAALGGIGAIRVNKDWPVSDDTIMHIATAKALIASKFADLVVEESRQPPTYALFAAELPLPFEAEVTYRYIQSMKFMDGRAPGVQCVDAVDNHLKKGYLPPFSTRAGGNGGSMRSMCIGLAVPNDWPLLVDLAMRAGLITHPNFTAMFGSVASAAFTALALEHKVDPALWPILLLRDFIPLAKTWLKNNRNSWLQKYSDADNPLGNLNFFATQWQAYVDARFDLSGRKVFSQDWLQNSQKRDAFYERFAYVSPNGSTWCGSSGHDSVIIAYDCFLYNSTDWDTVLHLSALHGGDSDSTAAIAGAFFGAYNGMKKAATIPGLEFATELVNLSKDLFRAYPPTL
jgi:ADP-ribosylarginine hydrolase